MDIAEIRKKAKLQTKVQAETQVETETFVVTDDLTRDDNLVVGSAEPGQRLHEAQDESAGFVTSADQPAALAEEAVVTSAVGDGLDKLFAATEEFVLATDESYADMLDHQTGSQVQNSRQYLAFHLCDEEYALDIRRISEIIKVREFTDIPRVPEFILGIISLRGVVVPVFDLRLRLKLGVSELTSNTRIVVCQQDDIIVGLLVDSINQVVSLTDDEVEPPPGVLAGLDREMVSGIGRYQGRMIILLNLHSALNVELNES